MRLTHQREQLPTTEPVQGTGAAAAAAAAAAELNECRQLLRTPSELLHSPRIRRRYMEALQWYRLYHPEQEATP